MNAVVMVGSLREPTIATRASAAISKAAVGVGWVREATPP
jgi:hypothetical protein